MNINLIELQTAIDSLQAPKNHPGTGSIDKAPLTLESLVAEMKRHEKLKYPTTHYTYAEGQVTLNNQQKRAIYVKYTGNGESLSDSELNTMKEHAIVVRKLSILAGILNAIRFSQADANHPFLSNDPEQSALIEESLARFYEKARTANLQGGCSEQVDSFILELSTELATITRKNQAEIITLIRRAEQYFVADYHYQLLINETVTEHESIIQMDISQENKLTDNQKANFRAIHNEEADQPTWFKALPGYEQTWFLQRIPKALDDNDWSRFEGIFQSSAMSHVPGIQNARNNYLLVKPKQAATYRLVKKCVKTGTMVPYKVKSGAEKAVYTEQTAEQVLDRMQEHANQGFKEKWGTLAGTRKPLIYNQILLSDIGAGNDRQMAVLQQHSIARMAQKYPQAQIICSNDPVNFLQVSEILKSSETKWKNNKEIIAYAKSLLQQLAGKPLTPQQFADSIKIKLAIQELENIRAIRLGHITALKGRNYNAYKAAYTQILVEALGGSVTTNCMSGKDRTGLDELYSAAINIYFERHGELPSATDEPKSIKRREFKGILKCLFLSMKVQEAAASNTPGSFGIKDTALMMDNGCRKWKEYQLANELSNMNKTRSLASDENREKKQKAVEARTEPVVRKLSDDSSSQRLQPIADLTEKQRVEQEAAAYFDEVSGITPKKNFPPVIKSHEATPLLKREPVKQSDNSSFWPNSNRFTIGAIGLAVLATIVGAALLPTGVLTPVGLGLLTYGLVSGIPLMIGLLVGTIVSSVKESKAADNKIIERKNHAPRAERTPSVHIMEQAHSLRSSLKSVMDHEQRATSSLPAKRTLAARKQDEPDRLIDETQRQHFIEVSA